MARKHSIVAVEHYQVRAFGVYAADGKPYDLQDALSQKLWSVVAHEFGPNAADVLVTKLNTAVVDHIKHAGRVDGARRVGVSS